MFVIKLSDMGFLSIMVVDCSLMYEVHCNECSHGYDNFIESKSAKKI